MLGAAAPVHRLLRAAPSGSRASHVRRRRHGTVTAVVAGVAALTLAGCGGSSEPTVDPSMNSDLLASARASGASAEQIAVLEGGEVTFEQYQAAVERTIACMRDAGIEVVGDTVTEPRGFPEIQYSFAQSSAGRSDEQTEAIADDCIRVNSMYVEAAHQTSPGSLEAQEKNFDKFRPALIQCLRDNGVDVADDAAQGDLFTESGRIWETKKIDCLSQAGVGR